MSKRFPFFLCAYDLVLLDCYYNNKNEAKISELYKLSDYLKQEFNDENRDCVILFDDRYIQELAEHPSGIFSLVNNDKFVIVKSWLKIFMKDLEKDYLPGDLERLQKAVKSFIALNNSNNKPDKNA